AFILDFPSTTLLECMSTGMPTALFYDPKAVEFEPEAAALLAKAVRICTDRERFTTEARILVETARQSGPMEPPREFLDGYCLSQGAAQRASEFFSSLGIRG
ncbi:MAG: hypothetical protein PHF00_11055, partial [Elusimicrobia bacterium]|nr:hypothetical protein [Elusimicrobiota bacterium]